MNGLSPTVAALCGSVATAIAIFGGGLAVEAYKRKRDRIGMALALAGAIDALLALIAARGMIRELAAAETRLAAGTRVDFATLIVDNAPFNAVTLAYRDGLGHLGGDLPFRVARFLVFNDGLLRDVERLRDGTVAPAAQAALIRQMEPVWREAETLGAALVIELRRAAGAPIAAAAGAPTALAAGAPTALAAGAPIAAAAGAPTALAAGAPTAPAAGAPTGGGVAGRDTPT